MFNNHGSHQRFNKNIVRPWVRRRRGYKKIISFRLSDEKKKPEKISEMIYSVVHTSIIHTRSPAYTQEGLIGFLLGSR